MRLTSEWLTAHPLNFLEDFLPHVREGIGEDEHPPLHCDKCGAPADVCVFHAEPHLYVICCAVCRNAIRQRLMGWRRIWRRQGITYGYVIPEN